LCRSLGKGSQEGNVAGARSHRNVLLTILLVISLCLFMARAVEAEGPIRMLSSTTRNSFPVELFAILLTLGLVLSRRSRT